MIKKFFTLSFYNNFCLSLINLILLKQMSLSNQQLIEQQKLLVGNLTKEERVEEIKRNS